MMPVTFRSRMALLFGLLSMLVGLPTYYFVSQSHRSQLLEDRRAVLQGVAKAAATVIAENLVERRREIELLAQSEAFTQLPLDSQTLTQSLERLKRSYPHYSWIGVTDTSGVVKAATSHHLVNLSAAQRPWFQQGLQGTFVGDLHEAKLLAPLLPRPESGQPIRFIDFASPVVSPDGERRGVLASHAHWQWAGAVLKAATPPNVAETRTDIFIVNAQNTVIYPEHGTDGANVPLAQDIEGAQRARVFWGWGDGQNYLTVSSAVPEPTPTSHLGWRVVVRQPESTVLQAISQLQWSILLITASAGAVFLWLTWVGANAMSRPLERLTATARRIQLGEEDTRFDAPGSSLELTRLAEALSGMASTLQQRKHALETANQALETKVNERTQALHRLNQELELAAHTDALTGLPNRMAANKVLASEHVRFKRSAMAYTILMLDVDFFKKVNDTHGHLAGDAVLKHVAGVIRRSLRESDFVARTGGEEFMVLLPMTTLQQAMPVAEKIRVAVASTAVAPAGQVTISIGVGQAVASDSDADAALRLADEWLYKAKADGRNRVAAPGH